MRRAVTKGKARIRFSSMNQNRRRKRRVGIPKNIVAARLLNVASNTEFSLTTKAESCCHFVDRFLHGKYEIGLRIDWSDMARSGDPTLDADFFTPGGRKPLREPQFKHVHHTLKTRNPDTGLLVYDFNFAGLSLQLVLELTREQSISGTARIVRPDQKGT
jgi:hypothetical protein